MPSDKPNTSFEQLVVLNNELDRQLTTLDEKSAPRKKPNPEASFSFKKLSAKLLLFSAGLLLPFLVLVRTSVYFYDSHKWGGWLSLTAGIVATTFLLLIYGLFLAYRYHKRMYLHKYIVRGIVLLVAANTLYGALYYSNMNTKTDEIQSYYRSLHPIIRVALSTITLADSDLVVTDIKRETQDYAQMGLPEKQHSLHYQQADGYVHAVDLRTIGRSDWKNWLTARAFSAVGLQTIRHVGTADHLHVYLPLNE